MSALETVASMKAAYEAKVAEFDALSQEIATDLKAAEDKGFDEGIKQAGIPAGDKIYTEEDLQNELNPLREQIANLQAQVDGMPSVIAEEVAKAVKAVKLEIAGKIKDAQVDDLALATELEA